VTGDLVLSGVEVSYGREKALAGVDAVVSEGRIVAIAGENGSGKSTLLKAVARVVPISAGNVRVGGESILAWPRRRLARTVAYAAQSVDLVFPIAVRELVRQGRAPWRSGWIWENGEDRAIAEEALRACDLLDVADRDATRISGGERRRAFLARLLAQRARIWLLDEPTSDLDPRHRLEFLDVLRDAHARFRPTVLWATHDINEALAIADDLLLLRRGSVVSGGAVAECLTPEALRRTFGIEARIERASSVPRVTFFR